jgi:ribonuclease-3
LISRLSTLLGYAFKDEALLRTALTHRSAAGLHNERLEFLGDSVLSFVVSAELYRRFPDVDEGSLSRLRSSLVKGEALAVIARRLQLGDYLHLGSGELKSGGFRRESILADALEAIIGAVYLDGGVDAARRLVLGFYGEELDQAAAITHLKDPKTRLQEWLQARRRSLPAYDVVSVSGDDHDQTFVVRCTIDGLAAPTEGTGNSRRKAEQAAAEAGLRRLEELRNDLRK